MISSWIESQVLCRLESGLDAVDEWIQGWLKKSIGWQAEAVGAGKLETSDDSCRLVDDARRSPVRWMEESRL